MIDPRLQFLFITIIGSSIIILMIISLWKLGKYKFFPNFKVIITNNGEKNAKKSRVLMVIAHPDDECMFFGPTILHFTLKKKAEVYLLCLSAGASNKEKNERIEELWKSCKELGINLSNITILKCDDMPDNQTVKWPTGLTGRIILQNVQSLEIDVLISFDNYGVSGHPNHVSIYKALQRLIYENKIPQYCVIYCLESVNIFRKYSLIFDVILSLFLSTTVFTATWGQALLIKRAMKKHKSQYVWFRKLYLMFSRYIFINTFKKIH